MDNIAVQNQSKPTYRALFTSSDTLKPGYALCHDDQYAVTAGGAIDTALADYRQKIDYNVAKPSFTNCQRFAGIVAEVYNPNISGSNRQVALIDPNKEVRGIRVWTDQSITKGDLLGISPGSYVVRRGHLFGPLCFRALETVDRSTTAGLVWVDQIPTLRNRISQTYYDQHVRQFYARDLYSYPTQLTEGASASSVTANTGAGIPGVVLTTNTTDNNTVMAAGPRIFKLEANKPLYFEIELAQNTTTAGVIAFGLTDTLAVGTAMFDDGATIALAATGNNSVIVYKLAAETTNWDAASTVTAAQTTLADVCAITAVDVFQKVGIFFDGIVTSTATKGTIYFTLNGAIIASKTISSANIASTVFVAPFVSIKTEDTTSDLLHVKYMRCQQPA